LGAEKSANRQEAAQWDEVADIRFQSGRGHDVQGETRREDAFKQRGPDILTTPGDELDIAGEEKYLASEDYQTATKHWERAAKAFRAAGDVDKARDAMEHADAAWEASRRALREAIELHKAAQE